MSNFGKFGGGSKGTKSGPNTDERDRDMLDDDDVVRGNLTDSDYEQDTNKLNNRNHQDEE